MDIAAGERMPETTSMCNSELRYEKIIQAVESVMFRGFFRRLNASQSCFFSDMCTICGLFDYYEDNITGVGNHRHGALNEKPSKPLLFVFLPFHLSSFRSMDA